MQRHNKNFRPSVADIINPFIDVSPPSEIKELTEAVQRLSTNLARNQAEIDRRGRELLKQKDQPNKAETKVLPIAALELALDGDRLCITGFVTDGPVELRAIRKGTGVLIEPIMKVCKGDPYRRKTITLDDLKSKTKWSNDWLDEATKNIPLFKKYLSGIGLKGNLRKLFFANSPEGLGFKFRTTVSQEEWNKLSFIVQQDIVKMLEEIGGSRTVTSQV